LLLVLATAPATGAQTAAFSGLLSGQLGAAAGGDVREWAVTPGASMAVIDDRGLGAELDGSYSADFDSRQFADGSITLLTINFIAMYPDDLLRPYVVAGAGVVRARAALLPGQSAIGQTDTAWSVGGGVLYMLGEALGLRGDIRYIRQFGRQNALPLGANGRLDFVRTSVGVTYSWPLQ
jgi:opacity protein-like surface antigen